MAVPDETAWVGNDAPAEEATPAEEAKATDEARPAEETRPAEEAKHAGKAKPAEAAWIERSSRLGAGAGSQWQWAP